MNRFTLCLNLFLLGLSPSSQADEQTELENAQRLLKTSFSQLAISHFGASNIPGVYEMLAGNRIIYFLPEQELLLFGEFFNKEGRSLTAEKRLSYQADKVNELNLKDALVIGEGSKRLIEFTDPDCPYCRKLHVQLSKATGTQRLIFFSIVDSLHPDANAKAVHVLCSADQSTALDDIFTNRIAKVDLLDCAQGRATVAHHKKISDEFGVSGTPTVVLGTTVVQGHREAQISQFLEN